MASVANPIASPVQSSMDMQEEDDKKQKQSSFFFVLLAVLPCGASCGNKLAAFLKNPLKLYTCFIAFFVCVHFATFEGTSTWEEIIGYISCALEAYGLISVLRKIQKDQSVLGISGNTMIMFMISYGLRQCEALIISVGMNHRLSIRAVVLELFQCVSIPLTFSITWCVFKTYRDTYQESLDKLKIKYLIPICSLLALILTPRFIQGWAYSYFWTLSFYVDVLALLPQVVMMIFSPGNKVAVPIANFVAATAFSRVVDLWFWYLHFDLGPQGWWGGFNYSGFIIVGFHIISLALVADFMYYYLRARCAAHLGEDKQAVVDEARGVLTI